jgi:hypothetical protein
VNDWVDQWTAASSAQSVIVVRSLDL